MVKEPVAIPVERFAFVDLFLQEHFDVGETVSLDVKVAEDATQEQLGHFGAVLKSYGVLLLEVPQKGNTRRGDATEWPYAIRIKFTRQKTGLAKYLADALKRSGVSFGAINIS